MAKQLKLKAQVRTLIGSADSRRMRAQNVVPANIYGKGEANLNLQLVKKEISNLLAHATSEHVLVDLEIADGGSTSNRLALIQEVQHHPVRRDIVHVDFHAVKADEKLHALIPIVPEGEADGVKNYGGILEVAIHELDIECLPKDLPESIRIDVTNLGVGQSVHVRDLVLPEGVTARANGDLTVIAVAAPRVEAEPAAGAGQPEVLKEKKADGKKADAKKPEGKK